MSAADKLDSSMTEPVVQWLPPIDCLAPGEIAYVNRNRLSTGEPAIAITNGTRVRHTDLLDLSGCVLRQGSDGHRHHRGVQVWVEPR